MSATGYPGEFATTWPWLISADCDVERAVRRYHDLLAGRKPWPRYEIPPSPLKEPGDG